MIGFDAWQAELAAAIAAGRQAATITLVNPPGAAARPLFTGLPEVPPELRAALGGEISEADGFALAPPALRDKALALLGDSDIGALAYDWRFWGRAPQIMPQGEWRIWMLMAGRGYGKTRCGAEGVRMAVESGRYGRIALVAPTAADARDVMVEGESGILAISPPWNRPVYQPSIRRLTWPSGALATTYSADEPERLRGPQHDFAWCDELAAWRFPEAWDMLQFGLRLGTDPRSIVTTTPRPTKLVKGLVADPGTIITRGSTAANRANLAPAFLARIMARYAGTRLGRQEIDAEILDDIAGALWQTAMFEADGFRLARSPTLNRIVVAIDPAATSGEQSDETGIVVAGKDQAGHGYVLDDVSGRFAPLEWAGKAIAAYRKHAADRIVAEVNNGGEMVEATIRMIDPNVPFTAVRASRGKVTRAEPIAALYEQGRMHHCGAFPLLEDQMCAFTGDFDRAAHGSPDRVDALVWAVTDLLVTTEAPVLFGSI
jgi:predicted phage terminase large subunit-like protein